MNCDNTLEEVFYKYLSHNDMKKMIIHYIITLRQKQLKVLLKIKLYIVLIFCFFGIKKKLHMLLIC